MRGEGREGWAPRTVAQTGLFVALGILLPILFHQVSLGGRIFLPMHIPVLLAGALIGPVSGLIVGIISPGLSFLLTGMPPALRVPLMTLELPIYGLVFGLLVRAWPRPEQQPGNEAERQAPSTTAHGAGVRASRGNRIQSAWRAVYPVGALIGALIVAQIAGRVGYGVGLLTIGRLLGLPFSLKGYMIAAFAAGVPGIIVQLILIPILVLTLRRHALHVQPSVLSL